MEVVPRRPGVPGAVTRCQGGCRSCCIARPGGNTPRFGSGKQLDPRRALAYEADLVPSAFAAGAARFTVHVSDSEVDGAG